jgi:FkbM family methyltransferase|tara:strand:+ start:167 stop:1072 length:906 start_codon:yes stop_codon:yes gene_type:complete
MKINLKLLKYKESIIDLPFFLYRRQDISKINKYNKVYFLLQSYLIIFLFKKLNENIFCGAMNLFFSSDGKLSYNKPEDLYIKNFKGALIYYPNKYRVSGSMVNHQFELDNLLNSYNLDNFDIGSGDIVIDCGANVGSLYMALSKYQKNITYIAYEPDPKVNLCLRLNLEGEENITINSLGLSDRNKNSSFYLGSEHGDSSLESFVTESIVEIETRKLDDYGYKKIKLLKIDAEGHEYEVLLGGHNTLKYIEFIAVDMGAEKGEGEENTVSDVTNFLLKNDFSIIDFNESRITGLFKNNKLR